MLSSAATQSQCRRRTPAYAAALRRSVCESSCWTSKDVYETSSSRLHAVSLTSVEAVYLRAPIVRVAVTDVPVITARSPGRARLQCRSVLTCSAVNTAGKTSKRKCRTRRAPMLLCCSAGDGEKCGGDRCGETETPSVVDHRCTNRERDCDVEMCTVT